MRFERGGRASLPAVFWHLGQEKASARQCWGMLRTSQARSFSLLTLSLSLCEASSGNSHTRSELPSSGDLPFSLFDPCGLHIAAFVQCHLFAFGTRAFLLRDMSYWAVRVTVNSVVEQGQAACLPSSASEVWPGSWAPDVYF